MAIQFSPIMDAKPWGTGDGFSAKGVILFERGEQTSPVAVLDDFRVSGCPFPPHPHAGFSALTYVFEDRKEVFEAATPSATTLWSVRAGSFGFRLAAARSTRKPQRRVVVSCAALRSSST